jgi:hypothetical protein
MYQDLTVNHEIVVVVLGGGVPFRKIRLDVLDGRGCR